MVLHGTSPEATHVILQHGYLLVITGILLEREKQATPTRREGIIQHSLIKIHPSIHHLQITTIISHSTSLSCHF